MLVLKNIHKEFNTTGNPEDLVVALDNVSLTIEEGEFVTIIGTNGSGKSTTMNIITGAMMPDKGQIFLNGADITHMNEHERARYYGRVFQDPMMGTASEMSVLENLEVAYRKGKVHSPFKWGFSKQEKEYFINELKKFDLGIEEKLNKKVGTMSGGQRQALTLLMATMRNLPSHKRIRKEYVYFAEGDKHKAKEEVETGYKLAKDEYIKAKEAIKKNTSLTSQQRKELLKEAYEKFDSNVRKFDVTKPILLLDEHTAALDPKTARKVLEITDKIVHESKMTALMITHNMADALKYGNRLIMFAHGKIVLDISGEEKAKMKVNDLYNLFQVQNDMD